MANNFFVSYDLMAPGQHYPRVQKAIEATGDWARIEFSFYYVKSSMSLADITKHVWASMDSNDKLIVIDTSLNNFYAHNIDGAVLKQIQTQWMN